MSKVVIYRTTLNNPKGKARVYIGIHTCDEKHPLWSPQTPTGYIGTSSIAQQKLEDGVGHYVRTLKEGWTHVNTEVLEEVTELSYNREDDYIRACWLLCGVAPEAKSAAALHGVDLSEFKEGICINCQTSTLSNLFTEETRRKRYKSWELGGGVERFVRLTHTEESLAKSLKTKILNGSFQRFLDEAHAPRARLKARETMLSKGGYKESTKKAIETAWTREAAEKRRVTRISKRTKYVIELRGSRFIGDKFECASKIGCSEATFMNWISGRRTLPSKYDKWIKI